MLGVLLKLSVRDKPHYSERMGAETTVEMEVRLQQTVRERLTANTPEPWNAVGTSLWQ